MTSRILGAAFAAALAICLLPAGGAQAQTGFTCRISADGKTVDAMIANPYPTETSCQVNCQVSTTKPGTTLQTSCTKNVQPGAGAVVLCSNTLDSGKLVKMVGGSGQCIKPLAADAEPAKDKDDDDDDDDGPPDPAKLRAKMRKQVDPDQRKLFDRMNK